MSVIFNIQIVPHKGGQIMKKIGWILGFVAMALVISSPCYADEWAISYDGSDLYDSATSVRQTSDGGYVVAGWTQYVGSDEHDFWVLRLASDGTAMWQKRYDRTDYDYGSSIQQTFDQLGDPDGYIVAGMSSLSSGGPYDFWILKLDEDGNITWQKTYDNNGGDDYVQCIEQTFDQLGDPDGYIVAGKTVTALGGDDFWVLKLDANGGVVWEKIYGDDGDEYASSIQQTTDGGYIVAGKTTSFGAGDYDFWVLKLDVDGNVTWQKTYGGGERDIAHSIQETTDSGYIVAGSTKSFGAGDYDFWVLKLSFNGTVVWEKTYGGGHSDSAKSIQQTSDGGYVIAGDTWFTFGAGSSDFWVLKLDDNGNITWERTYGGSSFDAASSVQQTSDGGYIVAGDTWSFGVEIGDLWVLKIDGNGQIPDCDVIGTSVASVSEGQVEGQDTDAPVGGSFVTVSTTSVSPQDTSAKTTVVCGPNQPPVLDPIGDKTVHEGNLLEFTVTAWDPNDDIINYSADNLPVGANFDPGTQAFSWTPASGQADIYPGVFFTVTDDGTPPLSDSETITITVTINNPPNVPASPSPENGASGIGLISPLLSWTGGDPDPGDTVTYDVYFGRSGPSGLKSSNQLDTSYTLGKLNCYTAYYWQIVATDDNGEQASGPVWSFTTTDAGCPIIEGIDPNPCNPKQVVTITGRNFGDTKQVIRWGRGKYKKKRVVSWADTRIEFKAKAHNSWPSGKTKTKDLWFKVGQAGSKVKSNRMPLTVTKP